MLKRDNKGKKISCIPEGFACFTIVEVENRVVCQTSEVIYNLFTQKKKKKSGS